MAEIFRSKIDGWLVIVMVAALAISLIAIAPAVYQGLWWVVIPLAGTFGFVLWVMLGTYYGIEGNRLVVRSGPFRWRIPINEIEEMTPTHNPLSSPALSLDRLRIKYSGGRSVMISPEDKDRFIAEVERRR
jgi:hypothetical protein